MAELKFAAHLHDASPTAPKDIDWQIPVLATEAQANVGVAELLAEIRRHRAVLIDSGALGARRRARRREEFKGLLVEELRLALEARLAAGPLAALVEDVARGTVDPYSAVEAILVRLTLE
jgi:LAO/AO transport system kinase